MGKLIDLTGQRFGRLTVVERAENKMSPNGTQKACWLCQCECGNRTVVIGQELRNGKTTSCGCFLRECTTIKNTTHGKRHTRLYNIWRGMLERCRNPNHKRYSRYGGRGITVCDRWQNDFQSFYDWAMANGYQDDLSIDRIYVNGNYEPSNCRWATTKEQNNNRSTNRIYQLGKDSKSLAEWCETYGVKYQLVFDRIKLGWTLEEALGLVPRKN